MKYLIFIVTSFLFFSCAAAPKPRTFSVNLDSPRYEAGETEAYLDRYLGIGGLKKSPVSVYYYPEEDAVCLQFKVQYVSCNQFWDKTGRDSFAAAFKRYQEEFEQKKLVNKGRKTREAYGSVPGYFAWKKTPVSAQAKGNLEYNLGYQFNKDAVFFTTTQTEAQFIHSSSAKSMEQTSPVLAVYYTRAQAESLLELFSREYLNGLGKPSSADTGGGGYSELDGD